MSDKRDCNNCKWAKWEMTEGKKPRRNLNRPGTCTYEVGPLPALPAIMLRGGADKAIERIVTSGSRFIWADDDLGDCQTWQAKEV